MEEQGYFLNINQKSHDLKVHPEYFKLLSSGVKNFEIRKEDDRNFNEGDILFLREFSIDQWKVGTYSGKYLIRQVMYVTRDTEFVKEGYCIMGLFNPTFRSAE